MPKLSQFKNVAVDFIDGTMTVELVTDEVSARLYFSDILYGEQHITMAMSLTNECHAREAKYWDIAIDPKDIKGTLDDVSRCLVTYWHILASSLEYMQNYKQNISRISSKELIDFYKQKQVTIPRNDLYGLLTSNYNWYYGEKLSQTTANAKLQSSYGSGVAD